MARAKCKAGGPMRGRPKRKRMGKGWSTARKVRGAEKPIPRRADVASDAATGAK